MLSTFLSHVTTKEKRKLSGKKPSNDRPRTERHNRIAEERAGAQTARTVSLVRQVQPSLPRNQVQC